jgi:hypothetical protein
VAPIARHVVAAERQHGERIAADAGDANRGGGGFRTHGGRHEHAVIPVISLINQREGLGQTTAEDEGRDRHASGIFPSRIDGRALRGGRGEARVGVGADPPQSGVQSLPCQSMPCFGGSTPMPSHHTSPSSVSTTLVKMVLALHRFHRHRVGIVGGAGRDAEEAGFRVDGAQGAIGRGLIQAMSSPTVSAFQLPKPLGGTIMARLVLPQALGKAAAT